MRKVSAIMSVYNEEKLLPLALKSIKPYVDEIIIIDGSENGPSTDRTGEIVGSYSSVRYVKGTYRTLGGAWDMDTQKNIGIMEATGDLLMFVSADMFFTGLDVLRAAIDADKDHKLFYVPIIELWLDSSHQRLYTKEGSPLDMPGNILDVLVVDASLKPYVKNFRVDVANVDDSEKIIIPHTFKIHLGWVRPFKQQVEKHIRHVKQHRWGTEGDLLLKGSESELMRWAIRHVLSYPKLPYVACYGVFPEDMGDLLDMKYNDGADEFIRDHESKYGSITKGHSG